MRLITYKGDHGELHTLMVDEFRDRYNTSDGYVIKYAVGGHKLEILESAILAEYELHRDLADAMKLWFGG